MMFITAAQPVPVAYNFSMDLIISNTVVRGTFNGTQSISATLLAGILNLALYFGGATQVSLKSDLHDINLKISAGIHLFPACYEARYM